MSRAVAFGLVASLSAAGLLLGGCGRTMTEADCERVGKHMRALWDAEAKESLPDDAKGNERAEIVIKGEGDRVVSEWTTLCRREIEGRRIESAEVDCILAAKSIAAVQQCASTPDH